MAEDGTDNVVIEDVRLRSFFGELLDGLGRLKSVSFDRLRTCRNGEITFAREMDRKHTLMRMPLIVT